jgi:molybdopterin-guanine dinucleotide biosynthesis protein
MKDERVLLTRFINTFQKALALEMEAMQRRFGPSAELPLLDGRALDERDAAAKVYSFTLAQPSDNLAAHMECTLKHDTGEVPVAIMAVDGAKLTLSSKQAIDLHGQSYTLVIYPWFLYEKLQLALDSLHDSENYFAANALRLFGKIDAQRQPRPARLEHRQLNASQRRAIQLCCDSNLAFVWGPPGTGKTTTLGHIVAELLKLDYRILITSTTNAAVDQVLAKLAELGDTQHYFERAEVLRIGQTPSETYGASLNEVTAKRCGDLRKRLARREEHCLSLEKQIKACEMIAEKLAADVEPQQLGLFIVDRAPVYVDLSPIFASRHANAVLRLPPEQRLEIVRRRQRRMERLLLGYRDRIARCRREFSHQEQRAVHDARVVLTTTTNMYVHALMEDARFDVVIVEEAGMTLLPALFYCACLARHKIIAVGDPKQLPAIVQADDDFIRKYLGANIFDVAIPDLHRSDIVAMLDIQYRMHPVIGKLVSGLYYDGKLRDAESTSGRSAIAASHPYPGAPLVVIDTEGRTTCATHQGQFSRFNQTTAQLCVDLAVEAIRGGIASVGIITPYAEQSRLIRDLLARFPAEAPLVECRTVHRFQGSERDMIILDTVDTAPFAPGVLLAGAGPKSQARNLVNVSISRARGKLVVVSDVTYFRKTAPASAITQMLDQAIPAGLYVSIPPN